MEHKLEQDLIRAAQNGDRNAVGQLYDAYADTIFRHLYYRVDDRATAEDLTSQVFLNLVESLCTYETGETSLLAWLYRVAHARLIDHYRRQSRIGRTSDLDDLTLGVEDDADGQLMNNHQQEKVRLAMDCLTEEQRQVIILRFMESCSLQKTADIMCKTIGAIKVMQYRALQSLNRSLSQQGMTQEVV